MMSVPESRAIVGRHDGINGRDRRHALVIVRPETVIGWHRKGFRIFWTWKSRRGKPGRPPVSREIRYLVRRMSRENPRWGAPRIHGELLKLGFSISQAAVSKYMVRYPARLSVVKAIDAYLDLASLYTDLNRTALLRSLNVKRAV